MADYAPLSKRAGPRLATHKGMPHAQIWVRPDPQVNAELFRRAFSLLDSYNYVTGRTLTRSKDAGQR